MAGEPAAAPPADVERLYGLPAADFTAARDATARRLRAERRRDEAAAVAKLRRPTQAAAVVNQLVRAHRDDVTALVEAGEAMRRAVADGSAAGLRDAAAAEREARERLVDAARGLLAGEGGAAALEKVRTTLHAAAVDPDAAAAVAGGALTRELEAVGLGLLPDGPVRAEPARRAERKAPAKRGGAGRGETEAADEAAAAERRREAEARRREARDDLREGRRRLTAACRAVDRAERALAAAEQAAADAREALAEAQAKADDARATAEDAERRLHEAERLLERGE